MKRTLDVNIAGFIYHIDQDAYDKLLMYINNLEKHYGDNEEAKEIIRDIEQRISELLDERKSSINMVFSINDVEDIIKILGTPEDIFGDEIEEDKHQNRRKRKLYRSRSGRIFAGVAAGVASYFEISETIVRAVFIILAVIGYGSPFLIYIIMWILIPEAKTPSQKLEMKGEAINVENIEKSIKKEYNDVKDGIKKNYPYARTFINKLGDFLYTIINKLGKTIKILIGILFIAIGIISMISFLGSLFLASSFSAPFGDMYLMSIIPDVVLNTANLTLFYICLILLICIPLLLITYAGIRLIFKIRSGGTIIGLACLTLWIFSAINIGIIAFNQFKNFNEKADTYTVSSNLDSTSEDIIYISNINNELSHNKDVLKIEDIYLASKDNYNLLYGKPEIRFEKSETPDYEIIIRKHAKSKTKKDAFKSVEDISYKWTLQDSTLYINRFFKIKNNIKWKGQKVIIYIKIPVGKKIVLDDYTYEHANICNSNFKHFYNNFNSNSAWEMNRTGNLINIDDQQ